MGDILSYENIISIVCYVGYGAGTRSMSNSTKSKTWTNSSDSDTDINTRKKVSENGKRSSILVGIGIQLVSFIVWAVVAIFFLGGSRQKMVTLGRDMDNWKTEWKLEQAHITKMDLEGSVATKNFITQYEKEQGKQYDRLKHLEDEVNHLDKLELRVHQLEEKQ